MSSLPIKKTLDVRTGDTFYFSFCIKDKDDLGVITVRDITGYTASGQIRKYPSNDSLLISDMTFSSTADELINGTIVMKIDALDTADFESGSYFYDIYVDDGNGIILTYFTGKFIVDPRITD